LPFDRIKIDRTFVTNLTDSRDSAAIVDAVTRLGKDLGLPVTAEGIENTEILERLRQYGDIKGQGFLYGQPQSATSLATASPGGPADHDASLTRPTRDPPADNAQAAGPSI
jgi:EAL domain-containing protein (putative c-di-GMP-specific phosphodiesterase class I)